MLGDAIAAALPELRAEAESQMTSTCTVRARDGAWVTNPSNGEAAQAPGAVVYSGKCSVRPAGDAARTESSGGQEMFAYDYLVGLPFDGGGSAGVREGMPCTFDTSPDPALVGVEVEVQKVARGDRLTARRLMCNEVS